MREMNVYTNVKNLDLFFYQLKIDVCLLQMEYADSQSQESPEESTSTIFDTICQDSPDQQCTSTTFLTSETRGRIHQVIIFEFSR